MRCRGARRYIGMIALRNANLQAFFAARKRADNAQRATAGDKKQLLRSRHTRLLELPIGKGRTPITANGVFLDVAAAMCSRDFPCSALGETHPITHTRQAH
jgi:hypothetical protein